MPKRLPHCPKIISKNITTMATISKSTQIHQKLLLYSKQNKKSQQQHYVPPLTHTQSAIVPVSHAPAI